MNKQSFIIEANSIHNLPISGDFSFNNSNKNLIIFCHGFKGFKDWGCWNLVSNYFCQRGFNFLKFNFSHNGTTVSNPSEITDFNAFRNNNYSIELQDIGRVINYVKSSKSILNHNNLYLIGHSRGGGIACLATQNHPEINRLVTWAGVADFEERFPSKKELFIWKNKVTRNIINKRTGEIYPQDYQFYEDFIRNRNLLDIRKSLSEFKGKFLVCYGSLDKVISNDSAFKMNKVVSNSEIKSFRTNHTFSSKHPWDKKVLPSVLEDLCKETIKFLSD